MSEIVEAFWETMNKAELELKRPALPILRVEEDPTDKPNEQAKAKKPPGKEAKTHGQIRDVSLAAASIGKDEFIKMGFKLGARIEKLPSKTEPDAPTISYTIKGIDDNTQTVTLTGKEGEKVSMTRVEIADQFRIKTIVETKAVISIGH